MLFVQKSLNIPIPEQATQQWGWYGALATLTQGTTWAHSAPLGNAEQLMETICKLEKDSF